MLIRGIPTLSSARLLQRVAAPRLGSVCGGARLFGGGSHDHGHHEPVDFSKLSPQEKKDKLVELYHEDDHSVHSGGTELARLWPPTENPTNKPWPANGDLRWYNGHETQEMMTMKETPHEPFDVRLVVALKALGWFIAMAFIGNNFFKWYYPYEGGYPFSFQKEAYYPESLTPFKKHVYKA